MTVSISYPEAVKALAEALATGEADNVIYYVTAAAPEETEEGTVYRVGFVTADPEEYDDEGDPTLFVQADFGGVQCMGPLL